MPRRITKTAQEEYVQNFETMEQAIEQIFIDLYGKPRSDEHIICGVGVLDQSPQFMSVGEIKKKLKEKETIVFHNISFIGNVVEKINDAD
jgi:hypothetical protein